MMRSFPLMINSRMHSYCAGGLYCHTVMKFLAAMTIVLTLPVLVASLYGMNVQLPLQDWPYAFGIIMVASVGLAALVARIFLKRDWM